MARVCEICGKSYQRVIKRSHSMRGTIRRLQPNLQWGRKDSKRVRMCTRCLKTQTKKMAIA